MESAKPWLLPVGVEEILPEEAYKLERLRRQVVDQFESWGYQLVIPPLIEFLDSLLVGTSQDLDLHTFKITDQLSGRMMGIRADITPQAARMDAHSIASDSALRLCYADSVLHTRPRGLQTSRVPIRVGAELFGHAGIECDVELICLMHEVLTRAEIPSLHLVIGHVGIYRALVAAAQLDSKTEQSLFEAVQRKAFDEIDSMLENIAMEPILKLMLQQLVRLSGGEEVLGKAQQVFEDAPGPVLQALAELKQIVQRAKARIPDAIFCFDLCELRGYQYHTGIVFAAYSPAYGRAIAKGGRYDNVGEVYGRARPASGFDADLKVLARLSGLQPERQAAIAAPDDDCDVLAEKISSLREQGEIVVTVLGSAASDSRLDNEPGCDRSLQKENDDWVVRPSPE